MRYWWRRHTTGRYRSPLCVCDWGNRRSTVRMFFRRRGNGLSIGQSDGPAFRGGTPALVTRRGRQDGRGVPCRFGPKGKSYEVIRHSPAEIALLKTAAGWRIESAERRPVPRRSHLKSSHGASCIRLWFPGSPPPAWMSCKAREDGALPEAAFPGENPPIPVGLVTRRDQDWPIPGAGPPGRPGCGC